MTKLSEQFEAKRRNMETINRLMAVIDDDETDDENVEHNRKQRATPRAKIERKAQ